MDIDSMSASNGRVIRENNTTINFASLMAPIPNGDQVASVTSGSIISLTPPNSGNLKAICHTSTDAWIRFGADPAVNVGVYCFTGSNIILESAEEIATIRIYPVNDGTIFTQFFK